MAVSERWRRLTERATTRAAECNRAGRAKAPQGAQERRISSADRAAADAGASPPYSVSYCSATWSSVSIICER
ncbi:hypothetical protein QF025_000029 [Paraburkholderia graminis]|uniref:Uncharacterized protein n=1 Tax=Paraburkholderia graminis TaxID=60548 RepID=A0ABD5C7R5_9BURK|nr:hypothetical protein [Paraburkholderia graminis]